MRQSISCILVASALLVGSVAECRVGGGRSFGSRGSRGFSAPSRSYSSPYRNYSQPSQPQQPYRQPPPAYSAPSGGSSMLKSLGAGLAGGFLGTMLFRSLGMGGGMGAYGGGVGGGMGGGGFGMIEFLLLAALLYFAFRMFVKRPETSPGSNPSSGDDGAARLMRQARPMGMNSGEEPRYSGNVRDFEPYPTSPNSDDSAGASAIDPDQAMDLFFQVQGAWSSRDLSPIQNIVDLEARSFLDEEINRLKSAHRFNRLENIAVRKVEIMDTWQEMGKEFSTVLFTANLLDYTIDENTQQLVEGSRSMPVKFEEFWTFARDSGSRQWRLSAIQQS